MLAFVWIADPQISPDGTKVAFTRVHVDREADEYRTTLWIGDTSRGDARPLTSGDRDSQPRWSPTARASRSCARRRPSSPASSTCCR